MKHSTKKWLSMLLASIMLLSLLPIPAYAGETEKAEHAHLWSDWVTVTAPTCTEPGSRTRSCACGASETEAVEALGHDWGAWTDEKAASCTEAGEHTHVCKRCEYKETVAIDALGHDWGEPTEKVEPTCTEAGSYKHTCARCEFSETVAVDALGHDWGEPTEKVEPTCTEAGSYKHTCARCELEETVTVDPLGHDWGEWTVLKEATKTGTGEREHTCARCALTEKETTPVLPPEEFTVRFMNGETEVTSVSVAENTAIGDKLPAGPDKGAAYVFEGWFDNENKAVNAETVITGTLTAHAVYTYLPEGSGAATAGAVTVNATWAPGVFPEGTTLHVEDAGKDKALSMAGAAGIDAVDGEAVDITFINNGAAIQPAAGKSVSISLSLSRSLAGTSFRVLHEKAAAAPQRRMLMKAAAPTSNVETVAVGASADSASFVGSSFSVYGIVGSEYDDGSVLHYYRNTYTFYAGDPSEPQSSWPPIDERIYRDGDTATVPEAPGGDSRNVFKGWFYTDEHGNSVEIRTGDTIVIDPATQEAAEAAGTEQSDHDYKVYASFGRLYTCTFYTDENMQLVYRSFLKETSESVELPDPDDPDQPLLIESGKTFLGWKKAGDPDSAIVPGPSVIIEEEDLQFVPVIVPAHRVEFDLVKPLFDDVAVARQMVPNGVQAAQPEGFAVGQIYRGYKLINWYKTYDAGSYSDPFDFTQPLTETDPDVITLYAEWEPTPVLFKVVPYTEDQNAVSYTARPGDAVTMSGMADSELPVTQILGRFPNKKYNDRTSSIPGVCHWSGTGRLDDDPVNGIMVDGRILPVIQVLDKDGNVTAEYDVAANAWVDGVVGTISPDGSTVVRMNYNRDRYKLSFVFVNRGDHTITSETTSFITRNASYPAGTTLNDYGMSQAPEGYDNSKPLPVITVKHAQHLYKVTHLVYDYGALFDPFFSKTGWFYEKGGMDSGGQTVFDASNLSMPIKPYNSINDGNEDVLKVGLWLNDIMKTYVYVSKFYQATSWEEIVDGAPLIQSSEMRINYGCTSMVSGYKVGHGHGFEIGKVSSNGYKLIAVTNQAGYKKGNTLYYPDSEPVTTEGNYTWYAKDGYSETGGGDAQTIYLHHIPAQFSITFRQTQNGTVDGWNVSDDTKEENIVIPGNYFDTDITEILAEYEPTDWTTLKDVRGIEYAAVPGWKGDVTESGAFPETMPPKNIVFYKEWTPLSFTAVFHPNNGEQETEQSVLIGGRIERIPNPTKTDEIFGGWYLNEGCTLDYDFSTTVDMAEYERLKGEDGRVHLYGKWNSPNPYYVLYDPGEGVLSSALEAQLDADHKDKESYYANAKVPVKGVAQKDGKVFIGWRIGNSDIILQHGNTFLADSVNDKADGVEDQLITLIAQYAEYSDKTSVTYHSNFPDGTENKESTILNLGTNDSHTIPYNAADLEFFPLNNRFWVFTGWNTAADGSGDFFQKGETPAVGISDNHLYAMWELRIPRKDIPVIKVWKDDNDRGRLRPIEIVVTLLADGTEIPDVPPITLTKENGWYGVFRDLPYADDSGRVIEYSVREPKLPRGYTVSVSGSWEIGFTITNSLKRQHSPFTGDHTPWLPWFGVLLLSGLALGGDMLLRGRKRRYSGKHCK